MITQKQITLHLISKPQQNWITIKN